MEYIMSKVLIVYGSTTGNTEALAEILGRLIQEAGHETTLLNAADASAPGLCDGWDMILFGCSAWGDDEIILQDDFDALFQQFDLINAKGHKVACFATGDSNFTYFCGAVDVIEAALERLGADVVVEGLKIDGQAQSDQPEIQEWTKAVIETLEALRTSSFEMLVSLRAQRVGALSTSSTQPPPCAPVRPPNRGDTFSRHEVLTVAWPPQADLLFHAALPPDEAV